MIPPDYQEIIDQGRAEGVPDSEIFRRVQAAEDLAALRKANAVKAQRGLSPTQIASARDGEKFSSVGYTSDLRNG